MTDIAPRASAPSVFSFESTSVRTFADDHGEPWFLANDVCAVLGYKQPRDAVSKHCRQKGVAKRDTPTDSGIQEMTWINEGNLYRLIIKSRKPEAERFETWVMEEVLPTIRKTGQYVPTLSSDTLLPSEQQTLTEVVHRKAATCGQQQGKAIAEIWSRVHRKFRVSRYAQLRREQLADVIHYVTQMTLRTPGATNSPQLHDTLNETVAHLVRHVESPNGAPAVVFMPLVNAVLRKQGFDLGARQVIDGEQAREIEDRLGRLMGLFHPMSAPFGDACGILRALRGLHPRLGTAQPNYLPVLGRA